MQIKKSQRRGRKACRSRRAGRKAYRSRRQARRSMHGGISPPPPLPLPPLEVITVYNHLPPTEGFGNSIKINLPTLDVLNDFITNLNERVGMANVFAQGRGMTKDQLINDLRNGELVIRPLDDSYSKYVIIGRNDQRPVLRNPIPEYVPPPSFT
jgi:hypothetical protein